MFKDSCSVELDDERSRSTSEVSLKRKFEELDESDTGICATYDCGATLTDSDYSEASRNSFSAGSLNLEKNGNDTMQNFDFNLSLDLNKAECKQYISKNFNCFVRVERNAVLDKEMFSNNSLKSADDHEVLPIDVNVGKCNTDTNETRITSPEEIILDSDDECTVICEIQKPNALSSSESSPLKSVICDNSLSSVPQTVIPPDSSSKNLTVISPSLSSLRTVTPQTSCDLPACGKIAHLDFLQSSPESSARDCLDVELHSETVIKHEDTVELTDTEFNIQILSVKSLGDSADYASSTYDLTSNKDDHRNSAELLDRTDASFYSTKHNISKCEPSYENNKPTVKDHRNINDSTNLTVDTAILDKDHFKYAEFYSEPRRFESPNDNLASAKEVANSSSCTLTSSEYQVSISHEQNTGAIFIPKLDELLSKIDIETINKVIKQSPSSDNCLTNNSYTASSSQNIIPHMSKEQSINICDLSANDSITDNQGSFEPSIKSDILETVNKIDFHQVLFLAKSGNVTVPPSDENSTPVSSVQNSIPFGEFLNETQQPPLMQGSTESESLPSVSENQIGSEMFWQHLKDAVTVDSNSLKESNSNSETACKEKVGISVEHQNAGENRDNVDIRNATIDLPKIAKGAHSSKLAHCSARFQQNISHLDKTSSSDMSASQQTSDSLKKEIALSSTADIHSRRTINNIHKRKFNEKELLLNANAVKIEKRDESPSDELDVVATASIRELSESKPESILPLFNMYKKELQQYNKIISAEKNVSAGLKMLEETQAKKLKHIEMAIHNLVKNDPCFYKVAEETQFGKTASSERNCNLPKEALKQEAAVSGAMCKQNDPLFLHQKNMKCDNCAQAAKLKCLGCGKVYFCTVECGKSYWGKGHYLDCS